jgi:hypothetical protein
MTVESLLTLLQKVKDEGHGDKVVSVIRDDDDPSRNNVLSAHEGLQEFFIMVE